MRVQTDGEGVPTNKLAGDSLKVCEEIGSPAKTIEEAKEDPKVCNNIYEALY